MIVDRPRLVHDGTQASLGSGAGNEALFLTTAHMGLICLDAAHMQDWLMWYRLLEQSPKNWPGEHLGH